jgi:hypothetical protein
VPLLNPRAVYRVLSCAAQVDVQTVREAAILGGMVACMMDTARFSLSHTATVAYVTRHVVARLEELRLIGEPPSEVELLDLVRRFNLVYDPA